MDDDSIESSGGSNLILISLTVLGIVMGGAGLYFGLSANQRLSSVNASVEEGSSSAVRLEKQIETLNTQVTELSAQLNEVSSTLNRVKQYGTISERSLKELAPVVKENREQLIQLSNQVIELGTRSVQKAPTQSASVASPANGSGSSSSNTEGTYTIASGDTFQRISSKTGVSLQALLDANPDADPRRLRIGQVINVPAN